MYDGISNPIHTDWSVVVLLVKCPSELQVIHTADSFITFSASGTKLRISPKPWNKRHTFLYKFITSF